MTIDYYWVVVATPVVGSGGRSFLGVFFSFGGLESGNAHSHAPCGWTKVFLVVYHFCFFFPRHFSLVRAAVSL